MTISVQSTITQVRSEHHTYNYKSTGLIVRRGFPVTFESTTTSLTVTLIPAHPQNRQDLDYSFTVSVDEPANEWSLEPSDDGLATLHIPPNAVVGLYTLQDEDETIAMAVLFNPFSEDDPVYMDNEDERNEYVLNDAGRIWNGSSDSFNSMPWSFAQFRLTVLLTSLHLLDAMPLEDRQDPVKVTRHLSAVLNSQDDNGVLVGNWTSDFSGGVAPWAWTGSGQILTQYWKTLAPVSYAQCWVFSGVFTSVMRSLGIPSRSITNFNSAHDTTKPYNRSVDDYYDRKGRLVEELSSDSIWNFHVWNSAWMLRPDLDAVAEAHGMDYNGWQEVDSTPQEESSDLYQLGPAPLTAIKHGFSLDYDTDFVIGEVNADIIQYWKVEDSEDFVVRGKNSRHVGQKISTKAVGADERNDVTLEYKFKEGTEEERASLSNRISGEIEPEPEPSEDVKFKVECPSVVNVGEPIVMIVRATNNGEDAVTIHFASLYRVILYTGTRGARIGVSEADIVVDAGESGEFVIEVAAEQYEDYLGSGMQSIKLKSTAKVQETGQVWIKRKIVRLNADEVLTVNAPESVEIGEPETVTAVITNISHLTLTGVNLRAEGEGLCNLQVIQLDDIEPSASVDAEIKLQPSDIGDKLLVVTLDTAELKDISRSVHIEVEDSSGEARPEDYLWEGDQSESWGTMVPIDS